MFLWLSSYLWFHLVLQLSSYVCDVCLWLSSFVLLVRNEKKNSLIFQLLLSLQICPNTCNFSITSKIGFLSGCSFVYIYYLLRVLFLLQLSIVRRWMLCVLFFSFLSLCVERLVYAQDLSTHCSRFLSSQQIWSVSLQFTLCLSGVRLNASNKKCGSIHSSIQLQLIASLTFDSIS